MNQNEVMELIAISGGRYAEDLKRIIANKDCKVVYDDYGAHIMSGEVRLLWVTVHTYVASKLCS